MKTVLAPNAPWPGKPVKKPATKRVYRAKPSKVDKNFDAWLKRQDMFNTFSKAQDGKN